MYKILFAATTALLLSFSPGHGGIFSSASPVHPFEQALKPAKGKDKEDHKMSGIDFVYVITAKKCHRYDALKRSFAKYNVIPYRFTSVNRREITHRTMQRACLHGSRRFSKFCARTDFSQGGRTVLKKQKMSNYDSGYIHQEMSIKKLSTALSHISCIKDAIDSGYQTIWIMDSGTELRVDPNILSSYVQRADKECADWTILYTDYSERDGLDNVRSLKKFFYRPDFQFLEPEIYFNRMFENYEEYEEGQGIIRDGSKGNVSLKDSRRDFMGRDQVWQHKKSRESRELLAIKSWANDGVNEKFTQATAVPEIVKVVVNKADGDKFHKVGLLKGAHSYILNKKGMKLIMEWYLDHQIFIPYAQEIQIIPGMNPYYIPSPVTRNQNKG